MTALKAGKAIRLGSSLDSLSEALDSPQYGLRIEALEALGAIEKKGRVRKQIGPALPSYDHVHTAVSYGYSAPGIHSVSRMVWAAHEAEAKSISIIEHESVAHLAEAKRAVALVNQTARAPMRLALGVEFKAPVSMDGTEARQFSANLASFFGQGEAAWVVGIGAEDSPELRQLVLTFQKAKYGRAERQLTRLNLHFGLTPKVQLEDIAGADGNITDRQLCLAVARANWPTAEPETLVKAAGAVRKLLNPGGPGYAPYPRSLPSYQQLITKLKKLGMIPVFTAQLRGRSLAAQLPLLKQWGIAGLDVAGIEPDEPNAGRSIRDFISLAEKHQLSLFGGSDYRGTGTGWTRSAAWMNHSLIRSTMLRYSRIPILDRPTLT